MSARKAIRTLYKVPIPLFGWEVRALAIQLSIDHNSMWLFSYAYPPLPGDGCRSSYSAYNTYAMVK